MDDFLARALQTMNKMQSDELEKLSIQFQMSLINNQYVFGKHAFRKHRSKDEKRSVINASLWDVMSTGLSRYSPDLVESREQDLQTRFYGLMNNETFQNDITYGTNGLRQVKQRFQAANFMLKEVFSDHSD